MAINVITTSAIDAHIGDLATAYFGFPSPPANHVILKRLVALPVVQSELRRIVREHYDHAWATTSGTPQPVLRDWHSAGTVSEIARAFYGAPQGPEGQEALKRLFDSVEYINFLGRLADHTRWWFAVEWNSFGMPGYR